MRKFCGQYSLREREPAEGVLEEKHAVCFRDRGRSLEANGLPGGAACFGGNAGLWHALRALVQTYEYCT